MTLEESIAHTESHGESGPTPEPGERILTAVLTTLEAGGYDEIYVQKIATAARVSLTTLYKLFGAREQLIAAALTRWIAATTYPDPAPPTDGETLHDGLLRLLRHMFEPWQRNPTMLVAYHRARIGPVGKQLEAQVHAAVAPMAAEILGGLDPRYRGDIEDVLTNLTYGLIGRYVDGSIPLAEILSTLERAVRRLTTDNEPDAAPAREHRDPGRATD